MAKLSGRLDLYQKGGVGVAGGGPSS
jgi:hypothetical protein